MYSIDGMNLIWATAKVLGTSSEDKHGFSTLAWVGRQIQERTVVLRIRCQAPSQVP